MPIVAPIVNVSTTGTISAVDQRVRANAAAGAITRTLPSAVTDGLVISVKKVDTTANVVTINTTGGQLIDGQASLILTEENQAVTLISNGSGWEIR